MCTISREGFIYSVVVITHGPHEGQMRFENSFASSGAHVNRIYNMDQLKTVKVGHHPNKILQLYQYSIG